MFLAGRAVDNGGEKLHFCWGAGTDNGLCSAPREGAQDESFVLAVLDWLRDKNFMVKSGSAWETSTRTAGDLPTYMYGHSGGGRMTWRAACNSSVAPRFAGMFITSALLAAELRAAVSATCNVSTMPPLVITHGTKDTTTDIAFEDESVAWAAAAAKCADHSTSVGVGKDADLVLHADCPAARGGFKIVYYRLQGKPHWVPDKFWYGVALDYWRHGLGPGMEGYEALREAGVTAASGRLAPRPVLLSLLLSLCLSSLSWRPRVVT